MRSALRIAAGIGVAAVGIIAVTPAMAAAPISQAGANAITVSLAGNEQGSGNVTAKNDGTGEKKTGETDPQIPVPGEDFFSGGVAAQEATATADDGTARSAACAGLAGDGGTVVNIGESNCLAPGDQISGSMASFNPGALFDEALAPLPPELSGPLATVLDPLNEAIDEALAETQSQFGEMGLVSAVKAISGQCTAGPEHADGSAHIVDGTIRASGGGQDITLLKLPVNPPPNTHVVTDLSAVINAVLDAVDAELKEAFDGHAADLSALTAELRTQVVSHIHDEVEENFAPLEQNVLDITLNKQVRPEAGAIRVNALDLQLLPAAQEQLDASLASLQIGNVVCGPNGRVARAAAPAAAPGSLPRGVSAGLETAPTAKASGDGSLDGIALGAFALMLAGGTTLLVVRRLRG